MSATVDIQSVTTSLTSIFHSIWTSSLTRVPPLNADWIVVWAVVAVAAVAINPVWGLARNAITMAHEGGHALVALIMGRRLKAIHLHSDTSGVTVSSGKASGPGILLTTFAGYCAPALWGLGCAALVSYGYATGALWLLVVLLLLMLTRIRNGYGLMALLVTLSLVVGISWWGTANLRTGAAYLLAWFLLIGTIRPLFELQCQRVTGRAANSDADQLAEGTGIPGIVWVMFWLVVALGALWFGSIWLTQGAGGIGAVFSASRISSIVSTFGHLGS